MNRSLILLHILLLLGCNNKQENDDSFYLSDLDISIQTDSLLLELKPNANIFHFNSDSPFEAICHSQSIIYFPKNCFVDTAGQVIHGNIQVIVYEFYEPSDIVLSNLSTQTSDGKLLETGGMLEIIATYNGEELILKPEESIKVYFKLKDLTKSEGMQLYKGSSSSKFINWDLVNDFLVFDNNEEYYLMDSILSPQAIAEINEEYKKTLDYYIFKSSDLRWLNCDQLITLDENSISLTINVDPLFKPVVNLVYKNYKTISKGYLSENKKKVEFIPVIPNEQFTIFAYCKLDNQIYLAKKDLSIGIDSFLDLDFKPVSLTELKDSAQSLEW